MKQLSKKLQYKLNQRKTNNAFRSLGSIENDLVDFSSNDYLGLSKSKTIFNNTHQYLLDHNILQSGATGSRLLSGNHSLYTTTESLLSDFHQSESALIFNSGYDANIGFFASVPQKGDVIFYDEYSHASIRDGILLSNAKAYKFKHNDLDDLKEKVHRLNESISDIYIITESVFSMDGDSPDLKTLCEFCYQNGYYLIIDEAHALGVFGNGKGLVQQLNLQSKIFARLITFGKALGVHGAAVLGSNNLRDYLINFTRSFIYTTALPPHTLATIKCAYQELQPTNAIAKLQNNIQFFKTQIIKLNLNAYFIESQSAIQCCIISDNTIIKSLANQFHANGFNVKPILSPTVPKGQERLRFCIHSHNSEAEITKVLELLATFVI